MDVEGKVNRLLMMRQYNKSLVPNFGDNRYIVTYSYKPGDIIEYMDYDNRVGTGIIGYTPITAEEANKRQLQLDHFDDSYLVYGLGEGDTHNHISSLYILGLADVTPEVYKQYKDKLKERYENN